MFDLHTYFMYPYKGCWDTVNYIEREVFTLEGQEYFIWFHSVLDKCPMRVYLLQFKFMIVLSKEISNL